MDQSQRIKELEDHIANLDINRRIDELNNASILRQKK